MDDAGEILEFWFSGPVQADAELTFSSHWFDPTPDFEAEMARRFTPLVGQALQGGLGSWEEAPQPCLALILLLDQFPRNLFRHTPRAFAGDSRAVHLTHHMIQQGWDTRFAPLARLFLYMPLEHAEDLSLQEEAVRRIGALGDPSLTDFALRHRDIIARFGRFPHRNAILGRPSTPEEERWLAEGGETFGQDPVDGAEKT